MKLRVDYPINGNVDIVVETRLFIRSVIESAFDVNIAYSDLFDGQALVNNAGKNQFYNMEQDLKKGLYSPGYEDNLDIRKCYENNKCVSFSTYNYWYLGGLVAYEFLSGLTFRKEHGKTIKVIKDSDSTDSDLQLIVKRAIKRKLEDNYELVHEENFENSPMPPKPPYLTKDGVRFDYSTGEIGVNALGAVSVIIPYEEIKQYMTDEAKLLIE